MSGAYPLQSDHVLAEYPVTREIRFPVEIKRFGDFHEQRYLSAPPTNTFSFRRDHMPLIDQEGMTQFFDLQFGRYAADWNITLDGNIYRDMAYDSDSLEWTEDSDHPTFYSCALKFTQEVPSPLVALPTISVVSPSFPLLTTTALTQLPVVYGTRYSTFMGPESPFHKRARRFELSTPSTFWKLNFENITDTERNTFITFLYQLRGAWGVFSLTYPVGGINVTFGHCRFNTNIFTIEYLSPNQNAIRNIPIEAIV